MKKALIIGITGQDAFYLSEFLHRKGYLIYGLIRGQNNPKIYQVINNLPYVELIEGDLLDEVSLLKAVEKSQPDEIYNLAAISFVKYSFENPIITANVTGLSVLKLVEIIKKINKNIRYYQASSAEMFGNAIESPQSELTPFNPQSPYAIAKIFAYNITKLYRETYGMFACSGILFNHESPYRGLEFVTRKISNAVAKISLGKQDKLILGNLDAKRDWGFAGDYVEAMWLMLQQDKADDYVIATGESHSVKEFIELAFKTVGIEKWERYVEANNVKFLRPSEVNNLIGNYNKAQKILGWKPKIKLNELVLMMVESDLKIEKNQ